MIPDCPFCGAYGQENEVRSVTDLISKIVNKSGLGPIPTAIVDNATLFQCVTCKAVFVK